MWLFRYAIAIITAAFLLFPGIARADCVSPAASAGHLVFSSADAVMQYCNGAEWIEFPKGPGEASCGALGNWEPRDAAVVQIWKSIAYGNGVFVAVADNSRVMTSADGIAWTDQGWPDLGYGNLTYGNGAFVFVARGRLSATSTDGINWTKHNDALPEDNNWSDVTYGNGWFVAVSTDGTNRVARSPDGINWTAHSAVEASNWSSVTYGNGMFVAVSYTWDATHPVMTSTDGATWMPQTAASGPWNGIGYGSGLFVVGGEGRVITSPDGANWTLHDIGDVQTGAWHKPAYGNGRFVITSLWNSPNPALTSTDGITWEAMPSVQGNDWARVAFGAGRFVAVAGNGTNRVMTAECLSPGCTDPDMAEGHIMYNADHRVMQWCDGQTWHAMGPLNPAGPNDGCENPVKPAANLMFNADYCILQYCDGDTWQGIGKSDPCACDPNAGAWVARDASRSWRQVKSSADGTRMIAVGWDIPIYVSNDSGLTWLPDGGNFGRLGAGISGNGMVLAAPRFNNRIEVSDDGGTSWNLRAGNESWGHVTFSADGTRGIATHQGNGYIHISTDSGMTWSPQADQREWNPIAMSADGMKMVAGTWGGQVHTSTDGGVTWIERGTGNNLWAGLAMSADGDTIVAINVGGNTALKSTDGGVSWLPLPHGPAGDTPHVAMSADGQVILIAVLGGPLRLSMDGGTSWENAGPSRQWQGVGLSADGRRGVASAEGDHLYTATCLGGG